MRRAICFMVACIFATVVSAQGRSDLAGWGAFHIDFAGLFEAHAAEVVQPAPDLRILEMDGPVIVEERRRPDGGLRYGAVDQSSGGAVGCLLRVLAEANAVVKSCPDRVTKDAAMRLNTSLRRAAQFYADNTYPKREISEIEGALSTFITARASSAACAALEDGQLQFLEALSSLSSQRSIGKSLAQPRLPVMSPCL